MIYTSNAGEKSDYSLSVPNTICEVRQSYYEYSSTTVALLSMEYV